MPEVIIEELHTKCLSADALRVLSAAVQIGIENPNVVEHSTSIPAFCEAASLNQDIRPLQLFDLLKEAQNAQLELEIIDTDKSSCEDAWVSINVLTDVYISDTHVFFKLHRESGCGGQYLPKLAQLLLPTDI